MNKSRIYDHLSDEALAEWHTEDYQNEIDAIVEKKISNMKKVCKNNNKLFNRPGDFEYYALTFTLFPDDDDDSIYEIVSKFLSSKMFAPIIDSYIRVYELTSAGKPHAHLLLRCTEKMYASNIKKLKCIGKRRFDLKLLRTPTDLAKWNNYLKKQHDHDTEHFGDDQYYDSRCPESTITEKDQLESLDDLGIEK